MQNKQITSKWSFRLTSTVYGEMLNDLTAESGRLRDESAVGCVISVTE
jgi:hypothetical protein